MLLTKIQETIGTATQADVDEVLKKFSNQSEREILANPGKLKAFRNIVAGLQSQLVATAGGIAPKIEVIAPIGEVVEADRSEAPAVEAVADPETVESVEDIDEQIAKLRAQTERKRKQAELQQAIRELAEADSELLTAESETLDLEEVTLQAKQDHEVRKSSVKVRKQSADELLALASTNGEAIGKDWADRTRSALNETVDLAKTTPLKVEIGVGRLGKHRSIQLNQLIALQNGTEAETPRMSLAASADQTVTLEAVTA